MKVHLLPVCVALAVVGWAVPAHARILGANGEIETRLEDIPDTTQPLFSEFTPDGAQQEEGVEVSLFSETDDMMQSPLPQWAENLLKKTGLTARYWWPDNKKPQ